MVEAKKSELPFKLKRKAKDEPFDTDLCCVQGCSRQTMVVDASKNHSTNDLPLCDTHWERRAKIPCLIIAQKPYTKSKMRRKIPDPPKVEIKPTKKKDHDQKDRPKRSTKIRPRT